MGDNGVYCDIDLVWQLNITNKRGETPVYTGLNTITSPSFLLVPPSILFDVIPPT